MPRCAGLQGLRGRHEAPAERARRSPPAGLRRSPHVAIPRSAPCTATCLRWACAYYDRDTHREPWFQRGFCTLAGSRRSGVAASSTGPGSAAEQRELLFGPS